MKENKNTKNKKSNRNSSTTKKSQASSKNYKKSSQSASKKVQEKKPVKEEVKATQVKAEPVKTTPVETTKNSKKLLWSIFAAIILVAAIVIPIVFHQINKNKVGVKITKVSEGVTFTEDSLVFESDFTSNDEIAYEFTVNNYEEDNYYIYKIENSNKDVTYELENYKVKNVIKGKDKVTIKVVLKSEKKEKQETTLKLYYGKRYIIKYLDKEFYLYGDEKLNMTEAPSKLGYKFLGWTNVKDGTEVKFENGKDYEVSKSMTLYPLYEKVQMTYRPYYNPTPKSTTVNYKVNHYQMDLDGENYTLVEAQDLIAPINSKVTPNVKTYIGFTAPEAIEITVAADGSTVVDYKYTRNKYTFSVTKSSDVDTSLSSSDGEYYYEEEITLNGTYNDTDYVVEKWISSNEELLDDVDGNDITFKMPAGNIAMMPSKALRTYTIAYDLADGKLKSGKVNPTSFTKETADITLNNPEKVGYTFVGWTGSNGNTPEENVIIVSGTKKDLVYVANYEANTNTPYQVVHKIMNTDGSTYTVFETEDLEGTSDKNTLVNVKSYTGFKSPVAKEVKIAADGSTVVEYYYTRNQYTFTLGSASKVTTEGSSISGNYYYGDVITLNATVDTGYSFDKWVSSNSKVADIASVSSTFIMPAENITMTPSAIINEYTLTINPMGGTYNNTIDNTLAKNEYGYVLDINEPTENAYYEITLNTEETDATVEDTTVKAYRAFEGWTLSGNGTFENNSYTYGAGDGLLTANYSDEGTATLKAPEKTGYVCKWISKTMVPVETNDEELDETTEPVMEEVITEYTDSITVTENTTLYATCTEATDTKYNVVYKLMTVDGQDYEIEETITYEGTTNSTVDAFVKDYDGFTSPEVKQVTITADGKASVEYEYVRNQYTFAISDNENVSTEGSSTDGTYYYGTLITLVATPDDGYKFINWSSNDKILATDANTTITMPASDTILTANVEVAEYQINYDLDGGSLKNNETNPESYTYFSEDITLNNPEKVGYTFTGWTGSNGETEEVNVTISTNTKGTLDFKANYDINTYNVAYAVDNQVVYTDTVEYNTTTTAPANPEKEGYTFTGWSIDGENEFDFTTSITDDITLNAMFEEDN